MRHIRTSVCGLAIAAAWGLPSVACSAQESGPAVGEAAEQRPADEIVVSGVRQSIESSIDDKRRATEIKDSVTAEDIGQLANDNIAEALQRITGVQVDRSNDGEGAGVQIRGLSENNVQINGEAISGTGADRGVDFQDLPAELFSGVEILKALSSDQIEGSLGGTINLQTRAPLNGKRDLVVNVSGTQKYAESGDVWNTDGNLFIQKQFRDTPIGEVGIIVNLAYKEIGSYAQVYGGGDFDTAPGIWLRKSGADVPQNNPNSNNANYNFFYQPNVSGQPNPYRYDFAVDPNGDGVSDASDIFYIPGQFGISERVRDDTKKSLNGTLQWRPASNLDIRFDTVLVDNTLRSTGANYSITGNVPRAGVLVGQDAVFSSLGETPGLGNVYVLDSGRLASFTNRIGAAPSENTVARKSQQYSLEASWDVTPSLNIFAKGSTSRGKANTVVQGQLNTGIEFQGGPNPTFNAQDFYSFVDFNRGDSLIPDVNFYEDPFPAPNYGVTSVVSPDNLVALDPTDINYARQRYFQYQRNAVDTENRDDSVRFDLTWTADGGFLKAIKAGGRWAQRGFKRASYQNANQNSGVYTQFDGVRDPAVMVNIQRVPVDPANTTDAGAAATSAFLQSCLTVAGSESALAGLGGNLPRTYGSTAGCDLSAIESYFNMVDIRAVNPNTGAGYYEQIAERFDVKEETLAGYLRADFDAPLGKVEFFGNVGVRYVKTKTTSGGYLRNPGTPATFTFVTIPGQYDHWLPSANLNFAFSRDLIGRFAYSRTLGRPGLSVISPALDITFSDVDPAYDGFGTAGNPNLKPVHSDNFDASLEWYYAKGSYISVAAFAKNIDSTIFLSSEPVDYQIGDQVFSILTYDNFGGTKIKGIELGIAHAFTYLPGLLSNLGVTANFTVVDEKSDLLDAEGGEIGRKGLSKYTYNLGGYYDDGKLSLRLAYNWRSAFTRRENVQLGFARPETLPEVEAARGQLDFGARFKVNRNIRFSFNAINLTNTGTFRYLKYPQLVNYLAFAGRRYNLGVSVSF